MRGYTPLMLGVLCAVTLFFGTFAALAIQRSLAGVAFALLVFYVVWLGVGLRAQQRTAVRVTVSAAGLDVAWIFGTHHTSWQQVTRIRFLRSRWSSSPVQLIQVLVVGKRPLQLFDRLNHFDRLVAQLREMRPDLIEE